MSIQAAIFDMDGLLLDSERICRDCFVKAGKQLGITVDMAVYLSCIGANEATTRGLLMAGHGADFPYDALRARWVELYQAAALEQPIPVKAGAKELLHAIAESNTPIALATSTRHAQALTKLRHAGLIEYFDVVVGGDQVSRGKPHPEIYLAAAAGIAVTPGACLAFEDSENGTRAALGAGMAVIQVPDLVPPSPALQAFGHTIVGSLHDVDWAAFLK